MLRYAITCYIIALYIPCHTISFHIMQYRTVPYLCVSWISQQFGVLVGPHPITMATAPRCESWRCQSPWSAWNSPLVRYPAAGAARPRHGLHEGQKQSPGSWGFSKSQLSKKKLKVIKKKINFPSKKIKLIKKKYSLISWPAQAKRKIQASWNMRIASSKNIASSKKYV